MGKNNYDNKRNDSANTPSISNEELMERMQRIAQDVPPNPETTSGVFENRHPELVPTEKELSELMGNDQNDEDNKSVESMANEVDDFHSRAEKAREKYNKIELHPEDKEEKKSVDNTDPGEKLFSQMDYLEKDSKERAERLAKLQEAEIAKKEVPEVISTNSVDDIINEMESAEKRREIEVGDTEDLYELIDKIEKSKLYAEVTPNEKVTGPAAYIIEENETYREDIKSILEQNNMRIMKKSAEVKNEVLNRYINTGDHITIPLINSGIWITISGAGVDEIMAMLQMTDDGDIRNELNKLGFICQHIVDSTVGKLTVSQLIKIVSYYDRDSLFYALFAATHPDESELSKTCVRCGQEYFIKVNTKDLLLNPEDFENESNNIKDNVTKFEILMKSSKLGQIHKYIHSNGMIIHYKHPSLESYLSTSKNITYETRSKYPKLIDIAYCIDKITIHYKDNEFIEYVDPNEIISIISKIKDPSDKYEIYDEIDMLRPNAIPSYGYKETTCPICGAKNGIMSFSMEDTLFTLARIADEMASLRFAAKIQRRKKLKEKSKTTKN